MTEKPILFSGEMVRAILDGRKTQTRRIMKIQPPTEDYTFWQTVGSTDRKERDTVRWALVKDLDVKGESERFKWPYEIGQRLWVRETFFNHNEGEYETIELVEYKATPWSRPGENGWCPSIFMPRRASRITLEVVGVRVERLNDISDDDAIAEGCPYGQTGDFNYERGDAQQWFSSKWEEINGKRAPWALNPWVWVIEFKKV